MLDALLILRVRLEDEQRNGNVVMTTQDALELIDVLLKMQKEIRNGVSEWRAGKAPTD
jgi:hypothetical protein